MILTFEEANGTTPRYVTMNWRNFFECGIEVAGVSKVAVAKTIRDNPPKLFGMEVFINPCISNEVIHLTFERMN